MSDTTATAATARKKRDFSIGRLLLEGRAFFALIAIIVHHQMRLTEVIKVMNGAFVPALFEGPVHAKARATLEAGVYVCVPSTFDKWDGAFELIVCAPEGAVRVEMVPG